MVTGSFWVCKNREKMSLGCLALPSWLPFSIPPSFPISGDFSGPWGKSLCLVLPWDATEVTLAMIRVCWWDRNIELFYFVELFCVLPGKQNGGFGLWLWAGARTLLGTVNIFSVPVFFLLGDSHGQGSGQINYWGNHLSGLCFKERRATESIKLIYKWESKDRGILLF